MEKIFVSIVLILFFFHTVSAQGRFELFENWYEYLNIPEDFASFPNLIYLVVMPFLAVMAIVFGVLTRIFATKTGNFFDKRIRAVIAFTIAFSLLYLGPLTAVVSVLLQVGSVFSVVAFFVMFFVLSIFFVFRRTTSSYAEAKKVYSRVQGYEKGQKDISDDIIKLTKEKGKLENKRIELEKKISRQTEFVRNLQVTAIRTQWTTELDAEYKKHYAILQEYRKDEARIAQRIDKIRNQIEDLRSKQREMGLKLK